MLNFSHRSLASSPQILANLRALGKLPHATVTTLLLNPRFVQACPAILRASIGSLAPRPMNSHPAIFLDRDGVLTKSLLRAGKPVAPQTIEQFELLPGVAEAIKQLHAAGFLLVVVTNQPDVRTGATPLAAVEAMHVQLRRWLPLDDIKVCYHVDADHCHCRKPNPGLLLQAAQEHGIDLTNSWMIGDRWRDVGAGKTAGCKTIFIDYDYDERKPKSPDFVVFSLTEAADILLQHSNGPGGATRKRTSA